MTPSFSQSLKQGHADTSHVQSSLAASTTLTTKVIETEIVTETETITEEARLEDEGRIELIDSDNVQTTVCRSCDKLKYSPVCGEPTESVPPNTNPYKERNSSTLLGASSTSAISSNSEVSSTSQSSSLLSVSSSLGTTSAFGLSSASKRTPKKGCVGEENKLIIGIDFGTTYTGVSYAFTSNPTEILTIKEWEGEDVAGKNDVFKVPSLIKYSTTDTVSFSWGYEVDTTEPGFIQGIKLSLDPGKRDFFNKRTDSTIDSSDIAAPQYHIAAEWEATRLHKSTVDIVADYIGAVYKYAMSKILEKGISDYIKSLKKEFTLTVPAIWSEEAKTATLRAARKAHPDLQLGPADLITEPEAAALCTFHAFSDKGFKKGDIFVICDAGGGTVDLISYQIKEMEPKLELKAVVSASGAAVGSIMLNRAFERYLQRILGEAQFKSLVESEDREFHVIMEEFESNIKRRFSSPEDWDKARRISKVYFRGVDIKDDPANNISRGALTVTGKTLHSIFDPLVTEIEHLVQQHIKEVKVRTTQSAKAVFLVGGFGASPYLKERLQKLVSPIDIVQPVNAWSAVVTGAVLSKIPQAIRVVANVAEKSYGVRSDVVYNPHEHNQDVKKHIVWDPYEDTWRIPSMDWYIYKGEDMVRESSNSLNFHLDIPYHYKPEDLVFEGQLEESAAECPPRYPWEDENLRISCNVTCNLRDLSSDKLKLCEMADGTKYYRVEFELVVTAGAALRAFAVRHGGVIYDIVEVAY